ncbi:MAG: metalloregulator ArsR/SmtB family transcription factor [Clostridiales bacterium]|jgi:DNA-binding transcriptional ArsR family regulator|nr:metalloregulator ArsR/SmtB family transcription factor [Clostridiales bacterium]
MSTGNEALQYQNTAPTTVMLLDKRTQNKVKDYMPPQPVLEGLADFFSVFSDITRIRIVSALTISEMCVNDLAAMLRTNQTTVSHQLKTLRAAGAVKAKRQGKIVFYAIANERINEVMLNGVEYLGF